jgi:hypothetical protein
MLLGSLHKLAACTISQAKETVAQMNRSLASFYAFFSDLARAKRARDNYVRLDALSDASLASRGLKRGDLVALALDQAYGK